MTLYQCPCCDYFTLEEPLMYNICPICLWEFDGIDYGDFDCCSGPNHVTLREARKHFNKHGFAFKGRCPVSEKVLAKYERKLRPTPPPAPEPPPKVLPAPVKPPPPLPAGRGSGHRKKFKGNHR